MRTSNYRKKRISKKTWKYAGAVFGSILAAGLIFFFAYFKVDEVEVMGSSHYSEKEVRKMVLRGPLASNSVLAPLLYTKRETEDIPFVKGYVVNQVNRNTICISVKEEKPVGCIPYLDSYIYFDRNGIFIESSKKRNETIPYFDGISVKHVIKDEELPIKWKTVLNTAVALATIFQNNETIPDQIEFDENYQISLLYGEITVMLGKDEFLEDKMTRAVAILPLIAGRKGILHLESVTDTEKTITFEEEVKEKTPEELAAEWTGGYEILPLIAGRKGILHLESVTDTEKTITFEEEVKEKTPEELAAEWTGGYEESGEYTGTGEFDENGTYVGPKPMTELEKALAEWTGGYDEEGDYTGAGEYDEYGNYVGPAPTEESIAAEKAAEENAEGEDVPEEETGEYTEDEEETGEYTEDWYAEEEYTEYSE